ncbi:MAG TPA: T9SS type A sorting domain-containing protein, partial [Chitinophagales bacterium]|nr:T9SS type A sorting domain-containing protein [Chitinophagales bacterium]
HSGKNQFRVKQIDYTGQPKLSKTVDFKSDVPEVSFSPTKVSKEINFTSSNKPIETMFEIYDQFGNIVKRGYASNVDVSNLPKGAYYLNYDNKMGEFIKK